MSLVLIHGSHGALSADAATGHIVERDLDGDEYAVALVDEIEKPARPRQRFTVGS
jgi:putative NADH-flavin reductase